MQRWQAKFEKPQTEYANMYGEDVRTIKRWIATGKKKDALPPLDEPDLMLGWYQHHYNRPPSRRLEELYLEAKAKTEPKTIDLAEVRGLSPQENREDLRRNLAIIATRLRDATERNDEAQIAMQQRNYNLLAETLRKWEVSLGEIEKASGASLPRVTVETAIVESLQMLILQREAMPKKILADLETTVPKRLSRVWSKLRPFLEQSVQKVRSSEEQIFRNLEAMI